jgi:hypothetical protein
MKLNKYPKELESHIPFNQKRLGQYMNFTNAKEMFKYSNRSFNKDKLQLTNIFEYEKERIQYLIHDTSVYSQYSLYVDFSKYLSWLSNYDVNILCRMLALFLIEYGYEVKYSKETNILHISWDAYEIE